MHQGGSTVYCVAPIVANANQTKALYWTSSSDDACCSATACTCFNQWTAPGKITGAYRQKRYTDWIASGQLASRDNALSKFGTSGVAMPQLWVTLASDPQAYADSLYRSGLVYAITLTVLWPVIGSLFVLKSTLSRLGCD